jgi:hypothetical protein
MTNHSAQPSILSLQKLVRMGEKWQEHRPNRALGGIRSATGFQYQFDLLLSRLCDALRQAIREGRPPACSHPVNGELLSDVLEFDEATGSAYIIQAKSTVRAKQVRSAFDEFIEVAKFIAAEYPETLSAIRFRIVSRNSDVADIDQAIDSCLSKTTGLPPVVRDALRTVAIVESPDPTDSIVSFLINELHCANPYDELSRLRGFIIGDAATPSDGVTKAWQHLVALRSNADVANIPLYWVTENDVSPDSTKRGDVLVGTRPHFPDLRAGRFAQRPQYEQLVSRFLDFLEKAPGKQAKQPIFWIEGRSGTGKSIALLHLLAHVKQTQGMDVLYIQGPSAMADGLRVAMKGTKAGQQVLLGVDDPYAPGSTGTGAWEQSLAVTAPLQDSGEYAHYPILVCCGPNEQRRRVQDEFVEQTVINAWELPNATAEDIDGLRSWYATRTGGLAPEIDSENILLVQLFFQWRMQQTIPEFASRLKKRLMAMGPRALEVVSRTLAANRLYLDFPTRGLADLNLTPAELDELNILLRQHHLEPSFAAGERVHLSHPHLANAIYDAWYPPGAVAEESRAAHLSHLLDSYHAPEGDPIEQASPIWSLCHSLQSPDASVVKRRLTDSELQNVLGKAYSAMLDDKRPCGERLALLPAWIELTGRFRALRVNPTPSRVARSLLAECQEPCRGMRLVCHKLLEFSDTKEEWQETRGSVLAVLQRYPDWHEWPNVAADVVRRHSGDHAILDLCFGWLRTQTRPTRGMSLLLVRLIEIYPGNTTVVSLVMRSPCLRSRFEGHVVSAMCNAAPAHAVEVFDAWARDHAHERNAARTLGNAIAAGIPAAVAAATEWCSRWHTETAATWVLEALLDHGQDPEACRHWALTWLSCNSGPEASYLIERLLAIFPRDTQVMDAAYQWLSAEPTDIPHWLPVWLTVSRQEDGPTATLIRLGEEAVRDAPTTKRRWAPAWRQLWRLSHGDPALIELVAAKLSTSAALQCNRSWLRAWLTAFHATSADRRMTDLGIRWLNSRLTTRRWAMTWTAIADARGEDETVIDCAIRWLAHNTRTWRVWAAIWLRCHKAAMTQEQHRRLADAGKEWFPNVPPEEIPSWSIIWQKVAKETGITNSMAEAANSWIANRQNWHSGDWEKNWSLLWRHDSTPVLRRLAVDWLKEGVVCRGGWPTVWGETWRVSADKELADLACQWLQHQAHYKHGSWVRILRDLVDWDPASVDIAAVGLPWLKTTPSSSNWWGDVWLTTARAFRPLSEDLVTLGNTWLTRSAPSSNSWGKVVARLLREGRLVATVPKHLVHFLKGNPTASQWGSLWRIYRSMPEAHDSLDIGRRWLTSTLKKNPANATWHMVWVDVLAEPGESPTGDLLTLGMQWLAVAPARITAWPNVWLRLWDLAPSDDLRTLGEKWIAKGFDGNPTYHRVVAALKSVK